MLVDVAMAGIAAWCAWAFLTGMGELAKRRRARRRHRAWGPLRRP